MDVPATCQNILVKVRNCFEFAKQCPKKTCRDIENL